MIAAKSGAAQGFSQVAIGFNWAYASGPAETAFWRRLGRSGGALFRRSVDWVGLDVYPGTWGPRIVGSDLESNDGQDDARRPWVLSAIDSCRCRSPRKRAHPRLGDRLSDGARRTEAMQVNIMRESIAVVNANRSRYHVTDYRWFDLRDADSSNSSFEKSVRTDAGRLHAEGGLRGLPRTRR